MGNVLQVENLRKVYKGKMSHVALDNVSFEIEESEFTAVMGPSGSGKSTLLQVISTIDTPTSGQVWINGKNPHALTKEALASFRRTELGFIFQDFNLIDTLTVAENIMLPLALEKVPVKEIKERTDEMALVLGIETLLPKRTFEISGGQAQRVAIARALVHRPSLILADEPTGNLDSKATNDVMRLLQSLNRNLGSTILMVTHDPYVASMCDRVLFIKDGSLYQEMLNGGNQVQFYQRILDMLTFLGGGHRDLDGNRL